MGQDQLVIVVAVTGGVIAGAFVTWLIVSRATASGFSEQRLRDMFASLSQEALRTTGSDFNERARRELESLTAPLKATLDEQQRKLEELERERQKAYGSIEQQLLRMTEDQRRLQQETARLVSSLRQPQARGRWGELHLLQVVELAGMSEYCDFTEQERITNSENKVVRPDLLVRLPNQRVIVVDAKVPLEAYFKAHESQDEGAIKTYLGQHVAHIKNHIKEMAKRDYQSSIPGAFDLLVLFIPGEPFYRAAMEHDSGLIEFAHQHRVILATPTTLIALLKTVALTWQEVHLAENARKIKDEGDKVYKALISVAGYVQECGKALGKSVEHYNRMLGSFERTLFSSAKRLRELDIGSDDLPAPPMQEQPIRSFSRPELLPEPAHGHTGAAPWTNDSQPLEDARER